MNKGLIIFDLDGTLIDTSPGIFNSVRYAEKKMGLKPVSNECLRKFVGPPPKETYKQLYNIDEKSTLMATKYHREYGETKALYEAEIYVGISEVLLKLKNMKYLLAVATLKKENAAVKVLEKCGIIDFFDTVSGMDKDETFTKAITIQNVWKRIGYFKNSILVGDTMYDYNGAVETGCDFIGVTYGFGFSCNDNKQVDEIVLAKTPCEIIDKIIFLNP